MQIFTLQKSLESYDTLKMSKFARKHFRRAGYIFVLALTTIIFLNIKHCSFTDSYSIATYISQN